MKTHVLYDKLDLKKEMDQEKNDSRRHFLKLLSDKGPLRSYSETPTKACLQPLKERFPNFTQVLEHLERQIALARLSESSVFTIRPILLTGAAGVGKTRFVKEVSKVMGMDFFNVSCGSITAGWVISGSSTSWSEGRPGMIHISLRDGETGNPVIMLDEIDKLGGDHRYDGYGPLYQLLEQDTAKKFSDEAVGLPIDCSKVSWIATANDTSVIPHPVLSRFHIMEVDVPSLEQSRAIIMSIYKDILEENADSWGSRFSTYLEDDVVTTLEGMAPREIRKTMIAAMGEAASGRDADIYTLELRDFRHYEGKKKHKIGF